MTNSENFIGAMSSMYNNLASNRPYLDSLNVFPVADSDTGTNLCRTVKAGADAVRRQENLSVNELLEKSAKAMLRSARGNSGVNGLSHHRGGVGNTWTLDDFIGIENHRCSMLPLLPTDGMTVELLLILFSDG